MHVDNPSVIAFFILFNPLKNTQMPTDAIFGKKWSLSLTKLRWKPAKLKIESQEINCYCGKKENIVIYIPLHCWRGHDYLASTASIVVNCDVVINLHHWCIFVFFYVSNWSSTFNFENVLKTYSHLTLLYHPDALVNPDTHIYIYICNPLILSSCLRAIDSETVWPRTLKPCMWPRPMVVT